MSSDLKKGIQPHLVALISAAVFLSIGFQWSFRAVPTLHEAIMTGTAGVVLAAVLVLCTNLIGHDIKHKLVYTRYVNEMPGSRADRLCRKDPRIDYGQACSKWPGVFGEAVNDSDRNARWYSDIYKSVRDVDEVRQSHRNFLLYRDAFSGLLMLIIFTGLWDCFAPTELIGPINPAIYLVLSISAFLSLIVARNAGHRMVVNAVAIAL